MFNEEVETEEGRSGERSTNIQTAGVSPVNELLLWPSTNSQAPDAWRYAECI